MECAEDPAGIGTAIVICASRTGIAVLGLPSQSVIFVAYIANGRWSAITLRPTADFMTWAATPGVRVLAGDFAGTGRTAFALTGVPGWGSIPVAVPAVGGNWTVTNQPATSFPQWAATPGATVTLMGYAGVPFRVVPPNICGRRRSAPGGRGVRPCPEWPRRVRRG